MRQLLNVAHASWQSRKKTARTADYWLDSFLRRQFLKLIDCRQVQNIQPKATRHTPFGDQSNRNTKVRRIMPQLQQAGRSKRSDELADNVEKPTAIWQSLERQIALRVTPLQCGRPVLIITTDMTAGALSSSHFQASGQDVQLTNSLEGALADLPSAWSLAVCHIDDFAEVEDVIDDLRDFRESTPTVPLLLVSSHFARDDLSTERLAICDASVRNDCRASALDVAISAAIQNNLSWNRRAGLSSNAEQMFVHPIIIDTDVDVAAS